MDRMTPKEREQTLEVILAEGREGLTRRDAETWLDSTEARARELHRRYVDKCNRPLREGEAERIAHLEAFLKQVFASAGLGLYLNGDPRGNPVGILTPKTGRYNTMGGAECGWRL